MSRAVTVAIPTLNAGPGFSQTLAAVRAQRLDGEVQLLVCDSGSSDDTVRIARDHDADIIAIPRTRFSHGGTRNRLMAEAQGDHVAFLTQDAVPESEDWLSRLLSGFSVVPDVGLVFGPYRARPGASLSVDRELTSWFASFSPSGPRVDALPPAARDAPARHFMGHLGFFTDANGCVARAAWEGVPFREIAYAEDHLLAQDMLRAGFAKVFVPDAAVLHSHDYSTPKWLRRSFDEARAVREVYGWSLDGRSATRNLRGGVIGDWRWARERGHPSLGSGVSVVWASLLYHGARAAGGWLGGHADRIPPSALARLSLERRV
jgi:glycosyltransferase involved in cell wall biosynthesis